MRAGDIPAQSNLAALPPAPFRRMIEKLAGLGLVEGRPGNSRLTPLGLAYTDDLIRALKLGRKPPSHEAWAATQPPQAPSLSERRAA